MKTCNSGARHIMTGLLFVISGFFLTAIHAAPADSVQTKKSQKGYPSFYHSGFTVDGKLSEWPSKLFYNNTSAQVLYAVANDSRRLYFCVQVLEQSQQMNIIRDGLTFTIEPNGKKKEACSIVFPFGAVRPYKAPSDSGSGDRQGRQGMDNMAPPPGDRPDHRQQGPGSFTQSNDRQGGHGRNAMTQKSRRFSAGLKLTGFNEGIDGIYPCDSSISGIETALAYDSTGALVIETAFPLSCFKQDLKTMKYISLDFEIKSMEGMSPRGGPDGGGRPGGDRPSGGRGGEGMQGGGPGGGMPGGQGSMGGGPGRGQGGGPGGEGPGGQPSGMDSQSQSKTYKISHKFCIASTP
ncbi:MAG: hypothetical protein M0P47_09115 [Bacteroidales bacterium]|nr:hypothetical protein [Bacteroidales bacterium]